jgi:hypothetical protein
MTALHLLDLAELSEESKAKAEKMRNEIKTNWFCKSQLLTQSCNLL